VDSACQLTTRPGAPPQSATRAQTVPDENDVRELFLMSDDVQAFIAAMEERQGSGRLLGDS